MNFRFRPLRTTTALLTSFAFIALPALAGQQDKPGQKPDPKPTEAAAKKSAAMAPMSLQLIGVTAENAAKASASVQALIVESGTAWKCPSCSAMHETKGDCGKCKKALVETAKTANAVKQASIDPAKGTLSLVLAPGESIDLQLLGRTLAPQKITIDEKSTPVMPYSRLAITAPVDSKDAQTAIQKALDDSKLFAKVSLRFDENKKQWSALVEGVNAMPTYGAVGTAIEKAGKDYHLAGMAWTGPCTMCAKGGMVQAGCKSCWHDPKASKG